ncbi:MAG: DUF6485 family protein [Patescibacteria group bacterium]|nr:DUF6485 family protein [Patescibacteria group bacterium]
MESCKCTYEGCRYKGMCCECVRHHREKGELPGCFFDADTEKTYDRTIEKFIETHRQ